LELNKERAHRREDDALLSDLILFVEAIIVLDDSIM